MSNKRIAIIGAGCSGIGAFKSCHEQGLDVVVYEKTDQICGLWVFRDSNSEDSASIYKSLTCNTSKELTSYSDFPPPKNFPNFMHNTKMAEYIESYANKIGFRNYLKLKHEVIKCEPNFDYEITGKWVLTIRNIEETNIFCDVFDGVMVCTGVNNKPLMPTIIGQNNFMGTVMHSHDYKTANCFENKRVVVVGIGNSGGDIGVELSNVCKQVYISTRTGSWVFNRVGPKGLPFDVYYQRKYVTTLRKILPYSMVCSYVESYLNNKFDHELYGIQPKQRVFSQNVLVNDDLAKNIISGFLLIKGDIECFKENGVLFKGESEVTECDAVIFSTGYQITHPFLPETIIHSKNEFNLYKNVFDPQLKHPKTMAFIGLAQPTGAVLPLAEMQCRWFASLMTDRITLPNQNEMIKDIQQNKNWIKSHYRKYEKYSLHVPWMSYMDELAKIIGVKPNLTKYFFTDNKLWRKLYFGPSVPYQYRLTGPNKWCGARDAIMTCNERIRATFHTRKYTFAIIEF